MPTDTPRTTPGRLYVWSGILSLTRGYRTDVRPEYGVMVAVNEDEARGAALRIVKAKHPEYAVEGLQVGEVPQAVIEEAGYAKQ